MSVREIPKSYVYTCDSCRKECQNSKGGKRPTGWHLLNWYADVLDYYNSTITNTSFEHLLCPDCGDIIKKTIDAAIKPGGE